MASSLARGAGPRPSRATPPVGRSAAAALLPDERVEDERVDATTELDLLGLARVVGRELPLMLAIDLLVTLACGLTAIAALGIAPLAPLVAALTLGPIWMGAVTLAGALLDGGAGGVRALVAAVRRDARDGIALAMAPAVVATLLIGSVGILGAHPDQRWLLIPIALDAAALVVVTLGCFTVFPLAAIDAPPRRGRRRNQDRWPAALALAGRDVTTALGLAALLVLLALSTRLVGPFLAGTLAGPFALLCVATTRRAVARATSRGDS